MKTRNFMLWITLIFISVSAVATTQDGNSNKSKPIIGIAPIMKSIGAMLDLKQHHLFDVNGNPVINVGSTLFVPSTYCQSTAQQLEQNEIDNEALHFFHFFDKDKDNCLNEPSHELNWFILDAKNTALENIQRWEDLNSTHINPQNFPNALIPAGTIPQSPYTQALLVPPQAEGYRIGFTYTPLAETGNPQSGQEVKVWDLSYFFGQQEPSTAGNQTEPNPGVKLHEIEMVSGGGIVEADYSLPEIKNLTMNGTFWVGESLEAKFDFESNSQNGDSEDLSRLWWGNAGTTQTQAYFQNQNYSTTHQSPVLIEDNINRIYEVSVLPIKKEGNYFVVGAPVTVKSDNENNNFTAPPSIQSLAFSNPLKINSPISATYQFNHGGASHAVDNSIYLWEYQNTEGQWVKLSNGNIVESGVVPASPALTQAQAGLNLKLTIEPKDQLGRSGDPVSLSEQIETLTNVKLSPETLSFQVGDTKTETLKAKAIYSNGTEIELTSNAGTWSSNNPAITVTDDGAVKIATNNSVEQSGKITFTYQNKTDTTTVTVNALPPSVSNLIINSGNIIKPNSSIGATYLFSNGGKSGAQDKSTYRWYAKQTPTSNEQPLSSGGIVNSGIVPNSPLINIDKAGWIIYLDVTAKDSIQRTGNTQTTNQKVEEVPRITNLSFTNHSNSQLKILTQVYAAYQFHNVEGSEDRSSYRFYLKNASGTESNLSSGTVEQSSSGSIISTQIPLDKAGWELYLEITPKDVNGRIGIMQTINMEIENLVSVDFTPESIYFLIPTQLTATATYSQNSKIDVTKQGKWEASAVSNVFVSIKSGGIVTASNKTPLAKATASIRFSYAELIKTKDLSVDFSNVSEVYGSSSGSYYRHLTAADLGSGDGFNLWGQEILESFRTAEGSKLIGGPGGQKCGPYGSNCLFDLTQIEVINNSKITIEVLNGISIVAMSWNNKDGSMGKFIGNKTGGIHETFYHAVRTNAELYGILVYASGPNNSVIGGVLFVYKN